MTKQRFELGKVPIIEISGCAGDLVVRSWMETAVMAKGNFTAEETKAGLILKSQGDLQMMVPEQASMHIEHVGGDLVIKNVSGDLSLNNVGGDAVLFNLQQAKVGDIHGDFVVKNMDGDLHIQAVYGDISIRSVGSAMIDKVYGDMSMRFVNGDALLGEVMGDVSFNTVNGDVTLAMCRRDVNLRNVGGKCHLPEVRGDIRLYGGLGADKHLFSAMGDVVVRWPINAPISLVAESPKITNRLPLEDVVVEPQMLTGRIGDGDTYVTLMANGRVILKEDALVDEKWKNIGSKDFNFDFNFDVNDFGQQLSTQMTKQVARITNELENRFGTDFSAQMADSISNRFGPDFSAQMADSISSQAEKAFAHAERAIERTRRHWEKQAPKPPSAPAAPPPPKKKSSVEEQLKILKMVENGTISPEEASMLLKALEN